MRYSLKIKKIHNHVLFIYKDSDQPDPTLKIVEILVPKDELVVKKEQLSLIIGSKNINYTYFITEDKCQLDEWWNEVINLLIKN